MAERLRFKQATSLQERLSTFANLMRERANLMPFGSERDELLRKASRADTASHLDDWANSPGLRPPK